MGQRRDSHTWSESTLRDYKQRLLRVLVHIQQHLNGTLSLEELAAIACFSPYHFHRVFKGMIGESLMGHIRRLRLERAAAELRLGDQSVTQIAFNAGYDTHEAFSRAFKASFGIAPIHFRSQKNYATLAATAPSGVHFDKQAPPAGFKAARLGARKMNVHIKNIEPMRVAFMRHVGPYDSVGATWSKLLPWLGKEGWIAGDSLFVGVCHDDPEVTPSAKIRYDACVTVNETFLPSGEIGVQTIAGGAYAVTTHFGPYHKLGDTYTRLFGHWLPRSGRELRSTPCFEIYLNDPESTEPEDLLTDVYVPLQPVPVTTRKGQHP
jgi:AraC family transcriptional regulator